MYRLKEQAITHNLKKIELIKVIETKIGDYYKVKITFDDDYVEIVSMNKNEFTNFENKFCTV